MNNDKTIAAVLAILEAQGLSAEDVLAAASHEHRQAVVPTVEEYLPSVIEATTEGAAKTYRTYWNQLVAAHGTKRLNEVRVSHLDALALSAAKTAVVRSNHRNGISARENCVGALRAFFETARKDGLVTKNLALDVKKPKRKTSRRRPLTDEEIEELSAATLVGDDPSLDLLLFRFHLETGARRGGALALRLRDLDFRRQCVRLREKGVTERWQPVSLTLISALADHAQCRGAHHADDPVFRRLPHQGATVGVPVSRRRYNTLVEHWHTGCPWAAELGVSIHWLRHTALATVERLSGSLSIARAFAGHHSEADVTLSYIKASEVEVAEVVALMTGEPHPLAPATMTP